MTITQASDRAIVNWQSFSIGDGNRVDIRQPDARSVLLNRVTGETTSTIAGSLNANGQVFLINPNGIQITSTGTVRAQRRRHRLCHARANPDRAILRSEEHTSELQSLMRISYAVFCLKKKIKQKLRNMTKRLLRSMKCTLATINRSYIQP